MTTTASGSVLVPLGQVAITPGAQDTLTACGQEPRRFLLRHLRGDWGDVSAEDQAANDQALHDGDRLLSAYTIGDGVTLWIITEADRSATTLLLPDEY
jgi:hypothetical protein